MTTQLHEFRSHGRPANRMHRTTDVVSMVDHRAPGGPGPARSPVRMEGWTPAHTEAARFVGECFVVGAVLGFCTELARPVWEKRHA